MLIDGIQRDSNYEYTNGSGIISFIPWVRKREAGKYLMLNSQISGVQGSFYTSAMCMCETPAAGKFIIYNTNRLVI